MRDDTAQTICLCEFRKKGDVRADPCSGKTHDSRFLSRAVVSSEIVGILYPDGFATFISFRSSGEGGPEHSSETDGTGIKTSQDESMTAGSRNLHAPNQNLMAIAIKRLILNRRQFGKVERSDMGVLVLEWKFRSWWQSRWHGKTVTI